MCRRVARKTRKVPGELFPGHFCIRPDKMHHTVLNREAAALEPNPGGMSVLSIFNGGCV